MNYAIGNRELLAIKWAFEECNGDISILTVTSISSPTLQVNGRLNNVDAQRFQRKQLFLLTSKIFWCVRIFTMNLFVCAKTQNAPANMPPGKLYIPDVLREAVLVETHDFKVAGHPGHTKTCLLLSLFQSWPHFGGQLWNRQLYRFIPSLSML